MAQTHPSFYVLDIPRAAHVARVSAALLERIPEEDGAPLARLGHGVYVIVRPVAKQLLLRHSSPADLLTWLNGLPGVALARHMTGDIVLSLYNTRDPAAASAGPTPPDAAAVSWHLQAIGVPQAWEILDAHGQAPLSSIRVAHLDTGFTRHPAFGDWQDFQNAAIQAHLGINYKEPGQLPRDPIELFYPGHSGHGTRTGSIIAANSPQMKGVAPGVCLVPYRVTNHVVVNFLGNEARLGDALIHAVNTSRCQVASISLGDPCGPGQGNGGAVDFAYDQGMIVVAAAGNITSEVTYPGRHSRVITAGGSTRSKKPWSGGSRGRQVDVCAPADEIFRAEWAVVGGQHQPRFAGTGDGTSFATAHIAGIACLWLARWGNVLDQTYPHKWQRVEAFRTIIRQTAERPAGWASGLYGAGIVNAQAALMAALPSPQALTYDTELAADDVH